MTPLIPAVAGALVVAGLLGAVAGLRSSPVPPPAPKRGAAAKGSVLGRLTKLDRRTRLLLGVGAAVVWTGRKRAARVRHPASL